MSQWKITTPASTYPITTAQALNQSAIDDIEANRQLISDAIADATDYAETATGLSFITRTITATYSPERDDMTPLAIPFPPYTTLPIFRGPLQAVSSVEDGYGNAISDYLIRSVGTQDFVQLQSSTIGPVQIVYTAGFGDEATSIPGDIKRGIVAHTAHMMRYREADEDSIPTGLQNIYSRYASGGITG